MLLYAKGFEKQGDINMKMRWRMALTFPIALAMVIVTGCLGTDDEDENAVTEGTLLVYQLNDRTLGEGTGRVTIIDHEEILNGMDVSVENMNISFGEYHNEDEGPYFQYSTAVGTRHFGKAPGSFGELVGSEMTWEHSYRSDESANWTLYRMVTEWDITYSNEAPSEIDVGSEFTMEGVKKYHNLHYVDGDLAQEENDEENVSVTYKVLERIDVEVLSGTFDCYKVRVDTEGSEPYEIRYFAIHEGISVKGDVFEDDEITYHEELITLQRP